MAEPLLRPVLAFMALVLCCGVLIAATAALTRERIAANRAGQFQRTLTELTGSAQAAANVEWLGDVAYLCNGGGRALLRGTVRGYGGDIRWLAAADLRGGRPVLTGVRVTAHQETPGIADFLSEPERGWLASLEGADAESLARVDTVTGATITSRAVRRTLREALARPALTRPPEPACPEDA